MANHTPEAMTAAQALDHLERIKAVTPRKMDAVLSVEVYAPGTVGGSPTVPVIGLALGFDWDSGKLIIRPEKQLTQLTPDQVESIVKSVREGNSWHAYERYKQHKAREKELSDQLASVTAQRDELLGLLRKFFDAYENGTPCYEDPDDFDCYLGNAFVLGEEIFGRICEVLNQHEKSNDKIVGES